MTSSVRAASRWLLHKGLSCLRSGPFLHLSPASVRRGCVPAWDPLVLPSDPGSSLMTGRSLVSMATVSAASWVLSSVTSLTEPRAPSQGPHPPEGMQTTRGSKCPLSTAHQAAQTTETYCPQPPRKSQAQAWLGWFLPVCVCGWAGGPLPWPLSSGVHGHLHLHTSSLHVCVTPPATLD